MASALTSAFQQQVNMPAVDVRRAFGNLVGREGVSGATHLKVTQRGAGANMSVDAAAGGAFVTDDHGSGGGVYPALWTAVENATIATSDPTNPRIDRIILRVHDQALGDADNVTAIAVLAGTPTSGANLTNLNGAQPVPGSSLLLANVLVGATVTSIIDANISDQRAVFLPAGGWQADLFGMEVAARNTTPESPEADTFTAANTAYGVRVLVPAPVSITNLYLMVTTTGGNADFGIYDASLTAVWRRGSVAVPAASGTVAWTIPISAGTPSGTTLALSPGYYYVVGAADGTTSAFSMWRKVNLGTAGRQYPLGVAAVDAKPIWFSKAESFPLPASITSPTNEGSSLTDVSVPALIGI